MEVKIKQAWHFTETICGRDFTNVFGLGEDNRIYRWWNRQWLYYEPGDLEGTTLHNPEE